MAAVGLLLLIFASVSLLPVCEDTRPSLQEMRRGFGALVFGLVLLVLGALT